MNKHWNFLLLLVASAIAGRMVYFYQFRSNPYFDHVPKAWDQTVYHEGGLAFAHGDIMAVAPNQANLFSPLYQYFVGFIYRFLGDQVPMVWITQFLMGTVSTILVYKIANHYFRPVVGFAAGLLFTLYGGNWFYEGILYREAFITFLGLLSCYSLLRFARNPTSRLMLMSALALSLLMQSRANNFLMVPVALIYLWTTSLRAHEKGRRLLAGYLAVLLITAIPLLAWGHAVRGFWTFYDQSGPDVFLAGNSLDYPGRGYMRSDTYNAYQERMPLSTGPVVQLILKTAWEHPGEFLLLYLRKVYYYFNNYEIPNSLNFYIFQEFAPVLGWGMPFALIGALGLTGGVLCLRRNKGITLLTAWLLADVFMVLPFCILSRFRLPVVPVLSIFAAYTLWLVWWKARERRWLEVTVISACVVLLGWAEKTAPLPEGKIRIRDHINFGTAYLQNNRPEDDLKGYEFYKRAWELSRSVALELREPEVVGYSLARYHYNAGVEALVRGDTRQGVEELKKTIYYNYAFADAHFLYAKVLGEGGFSRQALLEALQAVVFSPGSPDAHLTLGLIYQDAFGLPVPAAYHLKTALEHLPGSQQRGATADFIRERLDRLTAAGTGYAVNEADGTQIRSRLRKQLPPLRDFSRTIPDALKSPDEVEPYLILLYQYLTLGPADMEADIYRQLGLLYLKRMGVKEAAYAYLKKSWDKGIRDRPVALLLNELQSELSSKPTR